ncbi:MAG TPA: ABC transporter substrate-binding protein [Streptosporangiaceae bacterium]|jgi:NitT/TauT family transport system substrate-binding protein|nr:ABC transporter substrate-binding protein [Streptosporangiaceae bacterium]
MSFTRARRLSLAATGGLAVALLAACTSSGSGNSATTASDHLEKTTVTVGALPVVDSAGLYLARQNGYFQQAGLTVKITPVAKSPDAIPEMQSGKIDVVAGANYVSFFQAAQVKHLPLKLLVDGESCTDDTFEVLAKSTSGITSAAGLAHKTIAVNITNNIQTMLTNTALQAAGVNPASVKYVTVPFPEMGKALSSGAVDAISVVEPFITENELNVGAQPVLSTCTGPTANFPISGYFSLSSFTQKYPNTARAFVSALERGQALADSNRADVSEILPSYIPHLPANQAAVVNLGQYPTALDTTHLQRVADAMAKANLAPGFQVSSLLFH